MNEDVQQYLAQIRPPDPDERRAWPFSDEMDEALASLYGEVGSGPFVRAWRYPADTIRQHAWRIGATQKMGRPWREEELAALRRMRESMSPVEIARRLDRSGIDVRLALGRMDTAANGHREELTLVAASKRIGISYPTLRRLAEEGSLRVRYGTKGERLVSEEELARLLVSRPTLVNLRKVDRFLLWYLLSEVAPRIREHHSR